MRSFLDDILKRTIDLFLLNNKIINMWFAIRAFGA